MREKAATSLKNLNGLMTRREMAQGIFSTPQGIFAPQQGIFRQSHSHFIQRSERFAE